VLLLALALLLMRSAETFKKTTIGLIEQHYYLSKRVDRFGQFKDTAYVYLRKLG